MTFGRISLAEQLLWSSAGILLFLFALSLGLHFIDNRMIGNAGVWEKPMKFQISLAVHLASIALVVGLLGEFHRNSFLIVATVIACVAATAFEIAYIMVQAARQQQSHFNLSTPFYKTMYVLMASGAVIISLTAGVVGAAAWLYGKTQIEPALRLSILIGFVGGAALTLIAGFAIGGRLNPIVGDLTQNYIRMPVTGWSLSSGDLRVPHFLATHTVQAIPLAGLIASRLLSPAGAVAAVLLAALLWAAATWLAFQQAWAGRPFTSFF